MAQSIIGPALAPNPQAAHPVRVTGAPDLPADFPQVLDVPMAWTGTQFVDRSDHIHRLSESDLQEAESALQQFKGACPITMSLQTWDGGPITDSTNSIGS